MWPCSTCDDLKLQDIADLGAMLERLATDAAVGQRPAYGEVQVVRPRRRREAELEALLQHLHPQRAGPDVGVRAHGGIVVASVRPRRHHVHVARQGACLHHNAVARLRLAVERVARADRCNGRPRLGAVEDSAPRRSAMSSGDSGRMTANGASETTAPKSRAEDGVGSRSATGPSTSVGLWMKLTDEQRSTASTAAYRYIALSSMASCSSVAVLQRHAHWPVLVGG